MECLCNICRPDLRPAPRAAPAGRFREAWQVADAIKARGGYFELTPDRSGFFVRRVTPTADEVEWIKANRANMLLYVQHLLPQESFKQLQRSGAAAH